MTETSESGVAWAALDRTLFHIGGTPISITTAVTVLLIVLGALVTSHLVQHALGRAFRFRGVDREGTARATGRLVHYLIMLIGFGIALQTVGINLGALFAAGAIFAVGIGFAMQSIAQNFVSGVILLVERSIKPGDIVEINDNPVRVAKMGIRATLVETRDGENLIVPNSALIQSTVKNYTLTDKQFRVRVSVGVVYGSDMKLVFDTLNDVAEKTSARWENAEQTPQVTMTGFGDNSVNFDVAVWMADPWNYRVASSQLLDAIWWALKEKEIIIAFPQLDLHLDEAVVGAIRSMGKQG